MESTAIAEPQPDVSPSEQDAVQPRKIFISYAHEDQEFALQLRSDLDAAGVPVWIDETGIQVGESFGDKIQEALRECTEFVLILSPASRASKFVEKELVFAQEVLGMTIRPVLLHGCEPWLYLAAIHYIDCRNYKDYKKVLEKLKHPPRQTLWERFRPLREIRAARPYLAVIALGIVIAACTYFFSPSNTSFTVAGNDPSAIVVHVRNRGGRPSVFVASSFKLDFGTLPVETEPLFPPEPATPIRIPGHSEVEVRLSDDEYLTPKWRDQRYRYSWNDIRPKLPSAKITLRAYVTESDGRTHLVSEAFLGNRITEFIQGAFPNVRKPKYH
jgi:TIR domain